MFYLLSFLTGILECGWIAFGAFYSMPLWQILCYPLAYHIGNLFPLPFSLSHRYLTAMCIAPLAAGGFILLCKPSGNIAFVLTCLSLFFLSAAIQSIRNGLKSNGNRLLKRIFRVGGFAFAPAAIAAPDLILMAASVIALFALCKYNGTCHVTPPSGQHGFSAVMIFHQLHYFFYAHITLAAVSLMLSQENHAIGAVTAALLFCGTWITYMSVEPLVSKITSNKRRVFFAGHIGIVLLLTAMSGITDSALFTVLWVITGFGGGTVYTISALVKDSGHFSKDAMTISENIGHTLGLLTAAAVSLFFESASLRIMLISGALSAACAIIFMISALQKGGKQ